MKRGINAAFDTLRVVIEELKRLCDGNPALLKHLSKIIIKSSARMAVMTAEMRAMAVVRGVTREGANVVAAQGMERLAKTTMHLVGIAADVAQVGLEVTGHKKARKTVGIGGYIHTYTVYCLSSIFVSILKLTIIISTISKLSEYILHVLKIVLLCALHYKRMSYNNYCNLPFFDVKKNFVSSRLTKIFYLNIF